MSVTNPGELIDGRYRVQARLGTGGMADVYLTEDTQLERQVALKLLHRRFAEDPGFVERFRREAQSAANLQHPNVVAVYDRGSWDGTYYIAMEYLQGRTLKQVIRAEAPIDALRAIDISIQILKAARFAHRRGVIHRDLKPHNVMLDDQDHAKVTDFGIARAGASDMTETGSIMGTAQYLSPEQAQGMAVAEASDLYSIGIVLYEMLTGHLPFDAESAVTIALKHVSEAPTPPSRFNADIPPALEQTVLWALNKNPADRPQDADQFISVLEGIRESITSGGGGQVTASMTALSVGAAGFVATPGAEAAPRPRVQLGTKQIGAPSTVMHPITGEAAIAPIEQTSPPTVPPEGPQRRSRWSRMWPWLLALLIGLLIAGGVVAFILTRPTKGTVPVVVNLTQQAATVAVESAGFNPQVIQQASTEPSGRVIFQHPLGTTKASKGTTVDLTVSTGPGSTTVPAVVQLKQAQATTQLHLAGLKVSRVLSEASSTIPKGEATRTDPDAGTTLQTGQGVVLYLSSGVAPIAIPSVAGDTLADARTALDQFTVDVTQEPSSTTTAGTVISQDPTGGTALPGSTVSLVVAQKEPTVTVPRVVGQQKTEAESTLISVGLKVTTTSQPTENPIDDGVVISQSPSSGGKAQQGATVTLVVGRYTGASTTTGTGTTTATTTTTATVTTATTASTPAPTVSTTTTADGLGTTTAAANPLS